MTLSDLAVFTFTPWDLEQARVIGKGESAYRVFWRISIFEIQKRLTKCVMCLFWTHEKKIILGAEVNIIHTIYSALILTKGYKHCFFFLFENRITISFRMQKQIQIFKKEPFENWSAFENHNTKNTLVPVIKYACLTTYVLSYFRKYTSSAIEKPKIGRY